ncbi:MAG TPA: PBP1A family penicillin-binding protein [Acidimicrobiales bacterium]|nr:PBP1A family penicillin-binding protein [Acidimicrobiales bacterium]
MTRSGAVKRRNVFWRWRRLFYLATLVLVVAVAGVGFVVSQIELPEAPAAADQTTFICTIEVAAGQCDESTAIAQLHGEEDRVNVTLDQVPQVVIDAVIAAEDRDFFAHGGVDPVGISRAAWSDIRNSSASQQGGSTITQQYVKNVYLSNERTLSRKVREAVMAVKLEQELSKEQILENYLNTIYFGRGAYGIQAASRAYFVKDVGQLTLPDAALLAGLIRSPQRAEPYTFPEEARRRRRTVLDAMLEEQMITEDERDLSDAWPFDLAHGLALWSPSDGVEVRGDARAVGGEYFVEYVRAQLARRYGDDAVFGGGLRVYTTLDMRLQANAFEAVTTTLNQLGDPAGSLVAIDEAGQVRAMMGGTDYANQSVNLAVGDEGGGSGRQPGSTFKAFALAQALREGYSIESLIPSPSRKIFPDANDGSDWDVVGGCCGGTATLVEATAASSNTAYAQLALDLGIENVIQMARDLGVASDFPAVVPSVVLGSSDVSVLDMAAAYSTFANLGTRIEPRVITRVERADGSLVEEFTASTQQVLTPDQASRVTYALEKVVQDGTGEEADFGRPAAGKTGTTTENKDAWFVGYTPKLTAAVWMGYVTPAVMDSVHGETVQGGNLPARIWRRFMELATAGVDTGAFTAPADLSVGRPLDEGLGAAGDAGDGPSGGAPDGTGPTPGTSPGSADPTGPTDPSVPEGPSPGGTAPTPGSGPGLPVDPADPDGGGPPGGAGAGP